MFKGWSGWIVKSLCRVLVISGLTVMLTWNMVEMYMNRWVAELGLSDEVGRAQFKDWLLHIRGVDTSKRVTQTAFERLVEMGDDEQPTLSGGRTGTKDPSYTGGNDEINPSQPQHGLPEEDATDSKPEAVPVFRYLLEEDRLDEDEQVMSSDELAWWQDSISEEDKMAIFSLVMAKLPQDEYQNLSYLLEEGLTADETAQIQEILSRYLTEEEMSELANILQKYE